jgi:hypothetical protein
MKFRTLICVAAAVFGVMAISLQLVAQEPTNDRHRKFIDRGTLSGANSYHSYSPKSLVHSDDDSPQLNYWNLLSVLVDDQNGAPSVDPLSLQPPAILGNEGVVFHTYQACWKVAHPGPLDPPGTAIKCYSGPAMFEMGDGSLASNPNGKPDTFFSGVPCPLTGTPQFLWVDQATAYWNAVRFYNANDQLIEGYRSEVYVGKLYNYTTGKSIPLWANYVTTYQEEPGPDGTQNNLQLGFYGNDFSTFAGNTLVLTPQWGNIIYSPSLALVEELGPHPIDDYVNLGATAALAAICGALQ